MNALRLVTPPPSPKCFYCPKHRQNLAKGKTVCMIGSNLNPGVPGLTEQCKISALYCLMGHNHKSAMPHLTETIGWICFRPELTFKMIFHFPVGMKNPPIFSPYRMSPSKEFFPVIKVGEPEHDSTAPEKFGKLSTSYNIKYIKFNKEMAPDGPWLSAYTSPANIDFSQMKDWENPTSNANPLYYFTDQVKNPFFLLDNYRQNTGQNTINGKVELDYEFTPWFSAMYRLGIYNLTEESHNTTGKFAASGRRNVNGSVDDGSNNF